MAYRQRYYNNYDFHNNAGIRTDEDYCHKGQKHVHEIQGSTKIAEEEDDPHNHRFCTVTGEAIPVGEHDHVHEVCFRTDFFDGHYHEFMGKTGCAIPVGNRHVHFIESVTTVNDNHRHEFEAATLIEDPIKKNHKKDDCHDHDHDHGERMY